MHQQLGRVRWPKSPSKAAVWVPGDRPCSASPAPRSIQGTRPCPCPSPAMKVRYPFPTSALTANLLGCFRVKSPDGDGPSQGRGNQGTEGRSLPSRSHEPARLCSRAVPVGNTWLLEEAAAPFPCRSCQQNRQKYEGWALLGASRAFCGDQRLVEDVSLPCMQQYRRGPSVPRVRRLPPLWPLGLHPSFDQFGCKTAPTPAFALEPFPAKLVKILE